MATQITPDDANGIVNALRRIVSDVGFRAFAMGMAVIKNS